MIPVIQLTKIRRDGGTQSRAGLNAEAVDEYAESLKAGKEFPPVDVFFDGEDHWLSTGFHRVAAHEKLGKKTIQAKIHKGTVRDARLHSLKSNSDHGLRRTNADKRHAVTMALTDEEWRVYTDNRVADMCDVSQDFVSRVRAELTSDVSSDQEVRIGRNGKKYKVKPKKARKPKPKPKPAIETVEDEDDGPVLVMDRNGDEGRPVRIVKNDARLAIGAVCRLFDELGIYEDWKDVLQDLQNEVQKVRG